MRLKKRKEKKVTRITTKERGQRKKSTFQAPILLSSYVPIWHAYGRKTDDKPRMGQDKKQKRRNSWRNLQRNKTDISSLLLLFLLFLSPSISSNPSPPSRAQKSTHKKRAHSATPRHAGQPTRSSQQLFKLREGRNKNKSKK